VASLARLRHRPYPASVERVADTSRAGPKAACCLTRRRRCPSSCRSRSNMSGPTATRPGINAEH